MRGVAVINPKRVLMSAVWGALLVAFISTSDVGAAGAQISAAVHLASPKGATSTFVPSSASTLTPTPTALQANTPTPCSRGYDWTVGNPFPSNEIRALGVWFPTNGKFYTLGGRTLDITGTELLNPHEFTPDGGGTWAVKSATFDDARVNNMAGGVLNQSGTDYIFTVGGSVGGTNSTTYEVRRYDPVSDVITEVTTDPWPQPRSNILPGGFAVFGNKLYLLGGFGLAPLPTRGSLISGSSTPTAPQAPCGGK